MTAQPTIAKAAAWRAGAASHGEVDWHAIDWQKANQNVRRLQARIVKATQEGRWNKVQALQRLLTHSFSGKSLAVRRVTENRGKETPGVDQETWETPEKKAQAICALQQRGYRPRPLRRVYIPKKNGKKRPLGIPTMADRAMQALYLLALDPVAETTGDPNSYGFRQGRSTADAIGQCFTVLAKADRPQWVLEGDIKSCFDGINHDWLLANVPLDKAMLRKWLKAGYLDRGAFHPTDEGTPQGGIISPVLANLALDGLESRLHQTFPRRVSGKGKWQYAGINLIRYADDLIITGHSKEQLENEVLPLVSAFMQERGLELSREKTVVTHIEGGFDFLGQNVRKYAGKMLIKPSKESIEGHLATIRGIIKDHATMTAGNLIVRLNPVIRGWANYHRHVVSKKVYDAIDSAIFQALWRWARRRHPNKGKRWVKAKYFHSIGTRNWVFTGETVDQHGNVKERRLTKAADVPIRRHVKIQGAANPYDPAWETYFEHRLGVKMEATLAGRRALLTLWKRQNGLCPRCGQKITTITGWHSHHVQWRARGGSDKLENRELQHPNCHMQVHAARNSGAKPRPARGRS